MVIVIGIDKHERVATSGGETRYVDHSSIVVTLQSIAHFEIIVEQSLVRVGQHDRHDLRVGASGLPSHVVPTTGYPVVGRSWKGDLEG